MGKKETLKIKEDKKGEQRKQVCEGERDEVVIPFGELEREDSGRGTHYKKKKLQIEEEMKKRKKIGRGSE